MRIESVVASVAGLMFFAAVTSMAADSAPSDSISPPTVNTQTASITPLDDPAAVRRGTLVARTLTRNSPTAKETARDGKDFGGLAGMEAAQLSGALPGASIIAGFLGGIAGEAIASNQDDADVLAILTIKLTTGELIKVPSTLAECRRKGYDFGPNKVFKITGPSDHPVLELE